MSEETSIEKMLLDKGIARWEELHNTLLPQELKRHGFEHFLKDPKEKRFKNIILSTENNRTDFWINDGTVSGRLILSIWIVEAKFTLVDLEEDGEIPSMKLKFKTYPVGPTLNF